MNLKEHVQFLVMMIPTPLLLIAAVITLAAPAANAGGPRAAESFGVEPSARNELTVVVDGDAGLQQTIAVR